MLTSPVSFRLVRGQLEHLVSAGFDVEMICGNDAPIPAGVLGDVPIHVLPMTREISPGRDLISILRALQVLRRIRPDIINLSTPKAALIGSIAAALLRVPIRIYLMRGLRFETATGLKHFILTTAERVVCQLSHRVICVSASLRSRAIQEGLADPMHVIVLGSGSSNGVESEKFVRCDAGLRWAHDLRQGLGIPGSAPVVGFIGRFTRDKGIPELVAAFRALRPKFPEMRLLLVGEFEAGDPVTQDVRQEIETNPRIVRTNLAENTAPYYHLMDLLALPTRREGFPNVALEAQAASVPVVTTTATGAIDSVVPEETGIIVPTGDAVALALAIERLLCDDALRAGMGRAGYEWVSRAFRREDIWREIESEYRRLLARSHSRQRGWKRILKCLLDRTAAALGIILLSPLMLVLTFVIAATMGRPILFRQRRPGLHGQPFNLFKFRTMRFTVDPSGKLLPDEARLRKVGRILRSWSLDELPQLWNVLRGDLSLVGPRPLLMQYLDRYTPEQARRHDVMPGITGWAQINGRNAVDWETKFALDLWYVDNWTLRLDVKILFATIRRVIRREGVSQEGHATAQEFVSQSSRLSASSGGNLNN